MVTVFSWEMVIFLILPPQYDRTPIRFISGMRQGNDQGTQYRSGIYYYTDEHRDIAKKTKEAYQKALDNSGHGKITTEILKAGEFYYAEDYHQQYLHKNPNGYCGMGGTGVSCPIGLGKKTANKDEL